jgi:leucyl-tRNA synthetase
MSKDTKTAAAAPKSFARRDYLRGLEGKAQKKWEDLHVFECDVDESKPKYLITFPYPYMNGRLHLGHAFSMTKAIIINIKGRNVCKPTYPT